MSRGKTKDESKATVCPACRGTGISQKFSHVHCGKPQKGRYCSKCGADLAVSSNRFPCETCKGYGFVIR